MMNKSKVTKNCHFSINVSSFGPKMVVISFFGITQRQEIQTTSLLGTIYNRIRRESIWATSEKEESDWEECVCKKNNNVENVFSIISPRVFRFIQFLTIFWCGCSQSPDNSHYKLHYLIINYDYKLQIFEKKPTHCWVGLYPPIFVYTTYFKGRNFREQKLSRISRILVLFTKVYVAKFLELSHSRKLMFAKFSYECHSRKFMFAKFLLFRSLRIANPKYIVIF